MTISTPATMISTDTSSSSPYPSSCGTSIPKDAASPAGRTAIGPSLWRSILDTYTKAILECASDQFLDLAVVLRLETIIAKDLVDLPAKAGRPRHIEAAYPMWRSPYFAIRYKPSQRDFCAVY